MHKAEGGRMVLAVCDSDLIGKRIEQGGAQLDLTSDFYKGEEKSEQEAADLMRNAYILNIVGGKSVALAVNEGLVSGSHIKKIGDIPYAQCVTAGE